MYLKEQGEYKEALEHYWESLEIEHMLNPDSPSVSTACIQ
jgi:hypothetical protein